MLCVLIRIVSNFFQIIMSAAMAFFGKNEFVIAVVNEQSVFEPLKLYCM